MSILHTPPPAQPTDEDMMFGAAGPFNVKVLDEPTRAGMRASASRPSSPDQPGVEIPPRVEVVPLVPVMAATNARVVDRQTEGAEKQDEHLIDGREDRPRPGELVISENMGDDTTPSSVGNSHWPAGTPARGFGNVGFQAGRLKSVRFAGKQESEGDSELEDSLVPLKLRRTWARQASNANFNISHGHLSFSRSFGAMSAVSAMSAHELGEPGVEYSIFPKYIPLKDRRAYEVELVQRYDRLEINKRVGEFWYIIDAVWISQWITFVLADSEPPGVISNLNLFERESSPDRLETVLMDHAANTRARDGALASRPDLKLRKGMKKVHDYRTIHALLWYILREMYGTDGAPELCRWTHDVYTPEVTAQRKLRLEENSQPSAMRELRRFMTRVKDYAQELKE